MYCPKCGKENADNAQFCQSCGQSFGTPGQRAQPQPMQPQPMQQGMVERVPSYLGWAIVCIFLCWPFAIPAIVYASRVDGLVAQGNMQGAREASGKAKTWATVSTVVFAVLFIISIVVRAAL